MAAQPVPARLTSSGVNPATELAVYAAGVLSLAAGVMHLWAAPEHLAEWWGYGVFFLAAAAAQGLYGLALLRSPGRGLSLLGLYGNLALVSFYVTTRTTGVPFFGPHAGHAEAVGALDLAAVASELGLILALILLSETWRSLRSYLAPGAVQALGVGLVLHLLGAGTHEAHGGLAQGWFEGSLLMLPLSLLALLVATPLARRASASLFGEAHSVSSRLFWAMVCAFVYASAHTFADAPGSPIEAGRGAGVVLVVSFALLFAVAALRGAPWEERSFDLRRPRALAAVTGLAAGLAVLAGPTVFGQMTEAEAQQATGECNAQNANRSYGVAAVNVEIPFNRWGDLDPDGQVYVLQGDKEAVKAWHKPLAAEPSQDPAGNRRLRPRPLILRANVGECVKVEFTNELNDRQWGGRLTNPRASMQARGVSYNAQTSDGGAVGFNEDTSVPNTPGQNRITYFWRVPDEEGMHLFRSQTMSSGEEEDAGSNAHGLYGAIAVEPAGSTWTDPETGRPLYAGEGSLDRVTKDHGDPYVDADIHPAGAASFRESAQLAQDYNEVQPGMVGHGFNYGTEPQRNREHHPIPDGLGEEVSLSSWGYGDPALIKLASGKATKESPWEPGKEDCGLENRLDGKGSCYVSNVTHAYPNDPTKIRYAMAGVAETHVFHLHANQWLANPKDTATFDPKDPGSATLDSQTFGPGEAFTADLLYGAGSKPGTIGDSIFHCHLYPHFAEGFWSLLRVHDVRESGSPTEGVPGSGKTPDGTKVREVKSLPDRTAPAAPSADNPGFPRFIPGEFGWRAPQAPDSIAEPDLATEDPDDKRPAPRIVAGKAIPDTKLGLERGVQERNYGKDGNGQPIAPKPGAPLTDPCKPGPGERTPREVTYNVSVMQRDVVYNEAGWHDTQGRFLVLDKDVPKMLEKNPDGTYKHQPEPLFTRVNAGDCINFNLTNLLPNWFGGDAFQKLVQTNMMGQHIHLVKFDVLGSDGSSNGWNYQQAAFTREQMEFNHKLLADDPANDPTCDATSGCTIQKPATWNPPWDGGSEPGQTIRERWYADYELRTVFSHDHHFAAIDQNRGQFAGLLVEPEGMDFRNPKTGQFYAPINNPANGAVCADSCKGEAVGTAMDVIGPGAKDDFREFGLAVQDFVSLTKKGGDPTNRADVFVGPNAPEDYPDEDPGIVGVNYRNAPFPLRQEKNGQKVDPAYTFSSSVFGDPATPLLEAYAEDQVQIRLIQGSQEHQHAFAVNGMRWREDAEDPESPFVGTQDIGISEAFNMKVPKMECGANDADCAGDYLYSSTNLDDLYMGMWGILRARGKQVPSLLPLPDNAAPAQPTDSTAPTTTVPADEGAPLSTSSGALAPPEANSPGTPCAPGAPSRKYNVVAMEANIKYNKQGDHDPHGLIYALAEDEAAIRSGAKKPEPLTIRANEGDCVEVRLTNKLTPKFLEHKGAADGDAMPPLEPLTGTPAGLRVSLHPQTVQFDVRGSDGTAVGYNRDQTVGPGESRLYRWYADDPTPQKEGDEIGATNLTDFGDVRGHRHHGLFGGLNIEPKGSTYHDPKTGAEIRSGGSADIRVPNGKDFREFTTFFQDGLNLRDSSGAPIQNVPDPAAPHAEEPGAPAEAPEPAGAEAHDHIDQGEKGFNYASTPFRHRLGGREAALATEANPLDGKQLANVYSSSANGDPDTPVFRAFAGDGVSMRVLQGADKQRQHSFEMLGHAWRQTPGDGNSPLISAQGGFSVGRALNIHLPSAGNGFAGDYRYADGMYRHNLSGGLWGLMRVYPKPASGALDPTPLRNVDDPRANGNHPILPLEISSSATSVGLAAPATVNYGQAVTLSGKLLRGADPVVGRQVILEHKPAGAAAFSEVKRADTAAGGSYSFAGIVPQKNTDYRVRFAGDARVGYQASQSPVKRIQVKALVSNTTPTTNVKLGQSRTIAGAVTPNVAGSVNVTIKRNGAVVSTRSVPLGASRYSFSYKPPSVGSYSVSVSFPGNANYAANTSPVKSFGVIR